MITLLLLVLATLPLGNFADNSAVPIITDAPPVVPFEVKEMHLNELLKEQEVVNTMKNIMSCIHNIDGLKMMFLEEKEEDSAALAMLGIEKGEMVMENAMDAALNKSIMSFMALPKKLEEVIGCIQKFSPTKDERGCCGANKSIPVECVEMCSPNPEKISLEVVTQCKPHFAEIQKCYPTAINIGHENELMWQSCGMAASAGGKVGAVSAVTGNVPGAIAGFGVAAGVLIGCGIADAFG